MKKILLTLIVLGLIAFGAFKYFTRPIEITDTYTSEEISTPEGAESYEISKESSSASFTIDEDLEGKPFTVVGESSEIYGTVFVKDSILSLGEVTIDARTFKTDSASRDGAVARFIVKTEENPYVTFSTNETLTISDGSFSGSLSGNLTLAGKTNPVILTVSGTYTEGIILANVSGELLRSDFGLVIPNIPFVANVPDEFLIEANIVAN